MILTGEIIVFRFGVGLWIPVTWSGWVQVSKIHARHIYCWVWIIILGSGLGNLYILIVIPNFEFISHGLATLNLWSSFAAICLFAQNFPSTIYIIIIVE